jgi:uncharacterized protein (TIGR03083 family)
VNAADVRAAAAQCAAFLSVHVDADWSKPIPDLEWTVVQAIDHAAFSSLWYAFDLSAQGNRLDPMDPQMRDMSQPDRILTFEAMANALAYVVDGTPPGTRGFHPFGMADASGFAAMGCDEMLVHTDDAARGLGTSFRPDDALAARVVQRLFPWAPEGHDPWATLRWANGRQPLGDKPRLEQWWWHCAPLDEWTGTAPPSA